MPEYSPMPDIEAVAARILRTAGVTGGRVHSSVPARPVYPLTTVERLGGLPPERHRLDGARIQVAVWGDSKSVVRDAAELARRVLHQSEGSIHADFRCFVTGVEDELGLSWLPDPDTNRDRYIFAVVMYAHDHVT